MLCLKGRQMTFHRSSPRNSALSPWAAALLCVLGLVALGLPVLMSGCSDIEEDPSSGPATGANPDNLDAEHWETILINGKSAGFQCLEIHPVEHEGELAYRIDLLSEMKATQFGTSLTIRILGDAVMRPDGTPISFHETVQIGPDMQSIDGLLQGDSVQAIINIGGAEQTQEIAWHDNAIFMIGVPFSLWTQPMSLGETRALRSFELQQGMTQHQLRAKRKETVRIGNRDLELLRIEDAMQIGGIPVPTVYWADAEGTILKSSMGGIAESYQATREEALAVASTSTVDLGFGIAVPVARSLDPPHETRSVRYRVSMRGDDPSAVFPESDFQTVERIDDHTALMVVSAASTYTGSDSGALLTNESASANAEDTEPTLLITSDDPIVLRLAEKLSWSETPPQTPEEAHQAALDVVQLVHDKMQPGYGRGLVSAAEAAESLSGDCTEHAILAAAIARSIGLPARTAFGLVYVDQTFCFHMWTEVQIQGRWVPFDATLSSRGVGAAHIKLAHSSFSEQFPLIELLPTLRVLGKMDLEIVDIER